MHLEPANVGARREYRAVAPQPAEAFAVLQRGRAAEAGPVERQVAVAGHAVEKGGIAELRLVEAGNAAEFGTGKRRAPAEVARSNRASLKNTVAEKSTGA